VFTPGFDFLVGSVFPFSKTCVHSRFCFLGGVCLTLPEDLCSLQVLFTWWDLSFPSRGPVFTPGLFSWWGLSYPSRRPVFTPGFVYLVGSVFPFSRTCVHSGFCFLGGVCLTLRENLCSLQVLFSWWDLSFPSRGPVFTPGFVYLVGSVLPFPRTCVHSRFCLLGGVCLSLPEDLCSLQVLFSWWGLSFPSRGTGLAPGFVFFVGSVLPFPRICVHSRFCFLGGVCLTRPGDLCSLWVLFSWWGSILPFPRTCVHSRFCFLCGVCLTLHEDLC
jgi:hypothetical protein